MLDMNRWSSPHRLPKEARYKPYSLLRPVEAVDVTLSERTWGLGSHS